MRRRCGRKTKRRRFDRPGKGELIPCLTQKRLIVMTLIFESKHFLVRSAEPPLVDRTDGGHIIIDPKAAAPNRQSLTPPQAIELMRLTLVAGEAMTVVLRKHGVDIGRINYQDNGNWSVFKPEGPRLHYHLYGRAKGAVVQRYGQSLHFPHKDEAPAFYRTFRPLTNDDVEAVGREMASLLQTDKYSDAAWNLLPGRPLGQEENVSKWAVVIQPYQQADWPAVQQLFRLNTPLYFHPDEEKALAAYLNKHGDTYFTAAINGVPGGACGYHYTAENEGRISWTFVHPSYKGGGVGEALVNHCLAAVKTRPVSKISVWTSNASWKFFQKFGFVLKRTEKDFWAAGLDLFYMEMPAFV